MEEVISNYNQVQKNKNVERICKKNMCCGEESSNQNQKKFKEAGGGVG